MQLRKKNLCHSLKLRARTDKLKNNGAFLPPALSFCWKTKHKVQNLGVWEGNLNY